MAWCAALRLNINILPLLSPSLCIAHVIQEFASYVVFGVTVLITCAMMMRPAGQEAKHFMLIYGLPICVHLLITAAYSYIVLPFYRCNCLTSNIFFFIQRARHMEDVQAKSAFRLIIHPILSFINTLVSQTWVREFQNTTPFLATGATIDKYLTFVNAQASCSARTLQAPFLGGS